MSLAYSILLAKIPSQRKDWQRGVAPPAALRNEDDTDDEEVPVLLLALSLFGV